MKIQTIVLALALVVAPVMALADDTTAPPPPQHPQLTQSQRTALRTAMKSFMDQSLRLHKDARAHILSSLSSSDRALLGLTVSQLALSSNPDPKAAAQQLDARLSAAEKQSILAADRELHDQSKALFAQMRTQLESILPARPPRPQADGANPGTGQWNGHKMGAKHRPDPGWILLSTALAPIHGGHMHMMAGPMVMHGGMRGHMGAPAPSPTPQVK